jgi:hypothetical protein
MTVIDECQRRRRSGSHPRLQVDIVARLAPHVTMEAARAGLFALTQRADPFATTCTGHGQCPGALNISGVAAQSFVDTVVGRSGPVIIALTLAISLLPVIDCINIANLMLVRLLGRSRDIAVRQALGADPGHIAGRVLSPQLFGVSPIDPISLALATTVLLAVGLGTAYLPAHRAGRTDPMEVLRSE